MSSLGFQLCVLHYLKQLGRGPLSENHKTYIFQPILIQIYQVFLVDSLIGYHILHSLGCYSPLRKTKKANSKSISCKSSLLIRGSHNNEASFGPGPSCFSSVILSMPVKIVCNYQSAILHVAANLSFRKEIKQIELTIISVVIILRSGMFASLTSYKL